jgi:hypothetical protein
MIGFMRAKSNVGVQPSQRQEISWSEKSANRGNSAVLKVTRHQDQKQTDGRESDREIVGRHGYKKVDAGNCSGGQRKRERNQNHDAKHAARDPLIAAALSARRTYEGFPRTYWNEIDATEKASAYQRLPHVAVGALRFEHAQGFSGQFDGVANADVHD